jgi:non-reducing end alpha-L-arabinofuranosidase
MFSTTPTWRWIGLAAAFVLALALVIPAFSATPARAATPEPCDIYASGGTPCEAAYSTTRALFENYDGSLYQVQRASDSTYLNVGLESTGGVVNVAPENSFCAGTTCTITELYDQTANANNMPISPGTSCSGCSGGNAGPGTDGADIGAPAEALPVYVGGQPAYGIYFDKFGTGYRDDSAKNLPTGSEADGLYSVMSSNITSGQCCFDFGQGETNDSDDGDATMNAIYYGTDCWTGNCTGPGPWVGADIENGMYFSNTGNNPAAYPSETGTFVSAWEENNGSTNMTLQYGNGQSGGLIQTYSGALPSGYDPMKIQSSIELGTGGDNTSLGDGEFFEAADVSGFPSEATQSAVQANIVAAGYSTTPSGEAPYSGTAPQVPGLVQAANYDTGGQGVGYNVTSVNGTADSYRSDGVDLETTGDTTDTTGTGADYDVGWTASGQWFRYTVDAAGAGTYTVSLRLASPNGVTDGLHIANLAGTNLSGDINVPDTGGWQDWTTVTATVTLPAGTQTLVVDQDNAGWNLHYMNFAASGATSSWFEVVNQASGLCATAAGGSTANGTAVEDTACTSSADQLWKFMPTSVSGYYEVVNDNSESEGESWNITGGVGATAAGDTLQTWNYGGTGNTNALFSANLGSSGYYTFTPDNSSLCLDAPSTSSGVQLVQETCNSSTAQAFSLVPNSGINTSSWYEVVNEGSGLCASAAGGGTANGTAVEQLACTGATSQQWQFVATSVSGYYEVLNENAQSEGESWYITGGVSATAPGDTLETYDYGGTGNTNALFGGDLQYNGYYTFTADNSGLCVDTPSTSSGVQLVQEACNGNAAQAFSLLPSGTVTGSGSALTASPSSLSFGNQTVGSTSGAQTVTVSNPNSSAVSVSQLAVSGPFGQTNTCGASIAADGSCTVSVTFAPTAAGAATGSLTVTSGAPDSPLTVGLSGTGTASSATNIALGEPVTASSYYENYLPSNVTDGDTSNLSNYWESSDGAGYPQTITVNLGSAQTIGSITLDLPDATDWTTRTETLSVLGSTNDSTFTQIVASAGYTFNPSTGNTVTISLPSGTSAQYVELSFTANTGWDAAQLSQFEIFP